MFSNRRPAWELRNIEVYYDLRPPTNFNSGNTEAGNLRL